jgi:hypothetical protein
MNFLFKCIISFSGSFYHAQFVYLFSLAFSPLSFDIPYTRVSKQTSTTSHADTVYHYNTKFYCVARLDFSLRNKLLFSILQGIWWRGVLPFSNYLKCCSKLMHVMNIWYHLHALTIWIYILFPIRDTNIVKIEDVIFVNILFKYKDIKFSKLRKEK